MSLTYGSPAAGGAVPSGTIQRTKNTGSNVLAPYVLINPVAAAAVTSVSGSASSVTLLASSGDRVGAMVYNDSAAILYLKFGSTASTTSFSVKLNAGDLYEFPSPPYQGLVTGIWSSAVGAARITELT